MSGETDLYLPVGDARYEAAFNPKMISLVPIPSPWGHPAGAGADPADEKFLNEKIGEFLAEEYLLDYLRQNASCSFSQSGQQILTELAHRFLVAVFPILKGGPETKCSRSMERPKQQNDRIVLAPTTEMPKHGDGE